MAQPDPSIAQDMHPPKGSWELVHAPPPKGAWALHLPDDTAVAAPPALLLQLVVAALVLVVVPNLQALLNIFGVQAPRLPVLAVQGGYFLLALLAPIGAAALLGARAAGGLPRALGLTWNGWRGPILALVSTLPCWVGFALTAPLSPAGTSLNLLMLALLFPFADELTYRGFGFVFTRRALRWYLLLALLVQALAFSLIDLFHFWPVRGVGNPLALQQLLRPFLAALLLALFDLLGGYTLWCGWLWRASVTAATTVFAYYLAPRELATILPLASAVAALVLLGLFVRRPPAQ